MEPKAISAKNLDEILSRLVQGAEEARGTYLFKGFRLQISSYQASGAERTSRLYHKRREGGLCIRCGAKISEKNPKTGKLFRLCRDHREAIDVKPVKTNNKKAAKKK